MLDQTEREALITEIYDAALDPEGWDQVGRRLMRLTGSSAFEISVFDQRTFDYWQLSCPFLGEKEIEVYLNEMHQYNPRIAYARENGSLGRLFSDDISLDIKTIEKNDFINWSSDYGIKYCAGTNFSVDGDILFGFFLHRSNDEGVMHEDGLNLIAGITPHLERAAKIAKLSAAFSTKQALTNSLMQSHSSGIFLIDRQKRIVEANERAQSILELSLGMSVSTRSPIVSAYPEIDALLTRAADDTLLPSLRYGSCTISSTMTGQRIFLISRPMSVAVDNGAFEAQRPAALFYITTTGFTKKQSDVGVLQDFFGLSEREGVITNLLYQGHAPKVIAHNVGITENTVRNHIQRIYKKLGIAKQTTLTRLVAEAINLSRPT
ncbi:MAG: LuxR C-terminal-related transcriptional regulator [Pseudomonadota bacterium]